VADLCPMCGKPAVNTAIVWGAKIIGCPCVGDRVWTFVDRWSRRGFVQLRAADEREGHDPGDEDGR
jgi:hypothetical protein